MNIAPARHEVDAFYAEIGLELPGRGDKASVRCFAAPDAHKREDRNPSAQIDRRTGNWRCHACETWGGPFDAALSLGLRPAQAMELIERYGLKKEKDANPAPRRNGRVQNGKPPPPQKPLPTEDELIRWRERLLGDDRVLERLRARRGWTRPTVEALELGFDGERVVFPVLDGDAALVNVLRYAPGHRGNGKPKILAAPGRRRELFPAPERVEGGLIWIVEGEPDAVSARELGIPATAIPGVNKWDPSWAERFAGRGVVIMLDCDREGREAAHRIAESLLPHVPRVKVVDLDPAREDGYDLSDLLLEAGEGRDQARRMLLEMALEAPSLEPPSPKPPEAVDGAVLLDDLVAFVRRFVVVSHVQAAVVALWVAHAHAIEAAHATPYLAVTSAEKRSGKSLLLEVLELLVPSPLRTTNISDAALFRSIAQDSPTLLFDEIDAVFGPKARDREDLRGMVNAGHRRGAEVRRVGGANRDKLERFPVFCAKALAGIGKLPDTVADRSLPIRLERKAPGEKVERFRRRDVEAEAATLRDRLECFAAESLEALKGARPDLPAELDDRAQDGAEPLLAIADLAGGEWPHRARQATVELRGGEPAEDVSIGVRLLADVRDAFEASETDRLRTTALLEHLNGLDEAPWSEWRGKPLTNRTLVKLLEPYRVRSHTVRLDDGSTPKGYKREQFEDAWLRYLPATAPSIRHNATSRMPEPKTADSQTPQDSRVADSREAEKPHGKRDVADVADTCGFTEATDDELDLAERLQSRAEAA